MNSNCQKFHQCDNFLPKKKRQYIFGSVAILAVAAFIHGPMDIFNIDKSSLINRWIPALREFSALDETLNIVLTYLGPGLVALASLLSFFMVFHACCTKTGVFRWLRWLVFVLCILGVVAGFPKGSITFEVMSLVSGALVLHSAGQIPDKATEQTDTTQPAGDPSLPPGIPYTQPMTQISDGSQAGFSQNFPSGNVYTTSTDYGIEGIQRF